MKLLTYICRIIVGGLFIVSGLIKANDTLGFSYKLEEYFENGALAFRIRNWFGWDSFSLEFLAEYALTLAVLMCALEIILGFAVLFGTKIKPTAFALLGLTIVFFFLTLHTATCDPLSTYNQVTTVQVDSDEHQMMLNRMESNTSIVISEENTKEITFKEELPVQCVTDCGCFGDAMKGSLGRSLTPWESFWKDVILMVLIIPIVLQRKKLKVNSNKEDLFILPFSILVVLFFSWVFNWFFPLIFVLVGFTIYLLSKKVLSKKNYFEYIPIVGVAIIAIAFIYYTYNFLPLKDYRPYSVGKSIPEQMTLPEGAQPDVYENIFYYKNVTTGEVEEFTETNYPWDDDNYEFTDRETKLIIAGEKPAITDFTIIADDGNDYAQDYLNEDGYLFILVAYDISKTNKESFNKINTFVDQCNQDGNYFIGLTASLYNDVETFRHEQQTMFDFYSCDGITLKTIVRANPGVLLLKKGKILGKWHYNSLPTYSKIKENYIK